MTVDTIKELQAALPKLSASDAKFAASLVAGYYKYGNLTPKQEPWVGKLLDKVNKPAVQSVATEQVGDFSGVVALFEKAKTHLKFPKIRLELAGLPLQLSLAGKLSKSQGSVFVVSKNAHGQKTYFGKVTPVGGWVPSYAYENLTSDFKGEFLGLLKAIAANPAQVAKEHGKLSGNCCFCGLELTDPNSTAAGFGPVCADHYGLKHEWKTAVAKATVALDGVTEQTQGVTENTDNTSSTSAVVIDAADMTWDPPTGEVDFVIPVPVTLEKSDFETVKKSLETALAHDIETKLAQVEITECFVCNKFCPTGHVKEGQSLCEKCYKALEGV